MELKNCPFCGSDVVRLKYDKNGKCGYFYYVECLACQNRTHSYLRNRRELPCFGAEDVHEWDCEASQRACASWNRRV